MKLEVELKFATQGLEEVSEKLADLGAQVTGAREQTDHYFNHPAKDFAQTDEALRIRQDGDDLKITYKGPKIDSLTKTRPEIELPLARIPDDLEQWQQLLTSLGFRFVAEVKKRRTFYEVAFHQQQVEVTLDQLSGIGTFCELEIVTDEKDLETSRQTILELAEKLELKESIRRSYLSMVLERAHG